jgi:AbrB family looped-hinge helix DNA binding protein
MPESRRIGQSHRENVMAKRPLKDRKATQVQSPISARPPDASDCAGRRVAEGRPEASKVGKRGTVVLPAALRRRFGIEEGAMVIAEPRDDGILIRPAVVLPIEAYTPERKAQFLLSTAVDRADYQHALVAVRAMGLDPAEIPHYKPPGV